jgi:sugar phosphate isomerase/epimerase
MDENFSRLAPLLRHVRARDGLRGSARRMQPARIGEGHVDWPMLLANLDASTYQGFVTIDTTDLTDRRSAAVSALSFLKARAARR